VTWNVKRLRHTIIVLSHMHIYYPIIDSVYSELVMYMGCEGSIVLLPLSHQDVRSCDRQCLLTDLALIFIEKYLSFSLDLDTVVDKFAALDIVRRLHLK
jgi:hypothetical protein